MAHDVFISYSAEDKLTADAVCAALEARHIRCWIAPRDVLPGRDYAETLIEAIRDAPLMVLVFSSGANGSRHVLREVERAASRNIPILPFRIEDVPPCDAMEYYLSSTHWLDALTPPLERHLGQLGDAVEVLLARTGGATPRVEELEVPVFVPSAPVPTGTETDATTTPSAPPTETRVDGEMGKAPRSKAAGRGTKPWYRRLPTVSAVGAGAVAVVAVIVVVALLFGAGGGEPADESASLTTTVAPNTTVASSPATTAASSPATTAASSATTAAAAVSSGLTTTTTTPIGPTIRWQSRVRPWASAPPVVWGARVYCVGSDGAVLFALNTANGDEAWRFDTGALIRTLPAVWKNVVYFGTNDGILWSLDAKTGEMIWKLQMGSPMVSSPEVSEAAMEGLKLIYFGTGQGRLYAVDAGTGQEKWHFQTEEHPVTSSPVAREGAVYFLGGHGNLYSIDAETGKQRWRSQTVGGVEYWYSPTVDLNEQLVYVNSDEICMAAVDAASGEEVWRFKTGGAVKASAACRAAGWVYFGSADSYVYAVDAKTGQERWKFKTGREVVTTPTVDGTTVYVGSCDGYLYALNVETGREMWKFQTQSGIVSQVGLGEGGPFVSGGGGYLYALSPP